MILADTSVWIEFLKRKEPVFSQLRDYIERREVVALECIFGELMQGARNTNEREVIQSYWEALPKIAEEGLWIEAGRFSGEKNLVSRGVGLIDAFILTAAQRSGSRVWTLDKKLQRALRLV